MLRAAAFGALIMLVAACGCAKVASVAPVGERQKAIVPGDWEGTWINNEQAVKIKVTDPHRGVLQVAWAEEKGGRFVLESYQLEVWQSGEWNFGNFKHEEKPASYLWGLVKHDPGQIIVWTPDPEGFKKLVQTGILPGKVEKGGDVTLEKLSAENLKAMMS
jgi:hypothetical protein